MNYKETMKFINETAKFGSNYGLERTEKVLELLGNPHKKIKAVHIAGTNGKGSTTSIITSILMESGYKVGMYTSPFIEEFEERIQINKVNISKENLAMLITKVKDAVNKVIKLGYENPTEFEIITCAMFLYFYYENVDYAVVEVGLGGRLDSTNVISPILSVITSISYDHMNILGNTLKDIANEKCGIIKEEVPIVSYPQLEEAKIVIENVCKNRNSKLYMINKENASLIKGKNEDFTQFIKIKTENNSYDLNLKLLGKHQILNCLVAVKSCEVLNNLGVNITKENIVNGVKSAKWIGRMEIMNKNPLIVIDGAHNVDGIRNLKSSINDYFDYENITLILGVLGDKEVDKIIDELSSLTKKVILLSPHNYRAARPEYMINCFKNKGIDAKWYDSYKDGYEKALKLSNEKDLLLICGSLYMIGDMRKMLTNRNN